MQALMLVNLNFESKNFRTEEILIIDTQNLKYEFAPVMHLRFHYMIGALDTKSMHCSVRFYRKPLKFGRNIV